MSSTSPVPLMRTRLRAVRRPRRLGLLAAEIVFAVLVLAAVAPGLFTSVAPDAVDPLRTLSPPSGQHWFGTDQIGHDVFSRIVHGTRQSLTIGIGATVLGVLAGSALGLLAGLAGPRGDGVLMRIVDVLLAFPPLLLALLIIALAGPSTLNATLAIAAAAAPGYARLLRGQALVVKRSGYVEAAVGLGVRWPRVVLRHVLPNALGPLLVLATIGIGETILAGAGLSFLGLGPRPPIPEWGAMLSDGRDYLADAWWIAVFPGLAITASVIAITVIGRALQARFRGEAPR